MDTNKLNVWDFVDILDKSVDIFKFYTVFWTFWCLNERKQPDINYNTGLRRFESSRSGSVFLISAKRDLYSSPERPRSNTVYAGVKRATHAHSQIPSSLYWLFHVLKWVIPPPKRMFSTNQIASFKDIVVVCY
jgi:hypothetical protein